MPLATSTWISTDLDMSRMPERRTMRIKAADILLLASRQANLTMPFRTFRIWLHASIVILVSISARSQQTALSGTTSVGDAVRKSSSPLHLIYVHGISQIGPNDSQGLRRAICRYLKECTVKAEALRIWAAGPFGPGSGIPALTYLEQPVWSSEEQWIASTPYIQRYWISRNQRPSIILDELNWYPLAYALKCKFLLPADEILAGSSKELDTACRPAKTEMSGQYYLQYSWPPDRTIIDPNAIAQSATLVNRKLKTGLMDWGFGDAVMALGPMQDILRAAIRQLLVQSLKGFEHDENGNPLPFDQETLQVFFVTHSLGSYLTLSAMDSDWFGPDDENMVSFRMTDEQRSAADYFAGHTVGFYFLANQIALLELARLVPCAGQREDPCRPGDATDQRATPAASAVEHYARRRKAFLSTHPAQAAKTPTPQIVAWSAPDDLLSWYVPRTPDISPVNLPAKNSAFRIPGLIAGPTAVHSHYAENKDIVRVIFSPNGSTTTH